MFQTHLFFFVLLYSLKLYNSTSDDQPCNQYKDFATELLNDKTNFYNLQYVFFPPNTVSPVFVTVTYKHDDNANNSIVYYWSSTAYFFFHPVEIFQFTSLFFSDPSLRTGDISLTLPAKCANAGSIPMCMVLLTQRVGCTNTSSSMK